MHCPLHGAPYTMINPSTGGTYCIFNGCGFTYSPPPSIPVGTQLPAPMQYIPGPICSSCGYAIKSTIGCQTPGCKASAMGQLQTAPNNLRGLHTNISPPPAKKLWEATHHKGNVWRCWSRYDTGCPGEFPHGTKECGVCGRMQAYPKIEAKSRQKCSVCPKELSSYLDAYFGKDPEEAKKCTGCRK